MNKLYERISSLCEQRKIRPGRMCGDIGVSRGNITDLKMGRIESLSAETLSKISAYFGVTVDYLLGKTDFPYPDLTGKTMRFDPIETAPSKNGEGKHRAPSAETLKLLELLESREDIRYLAAASEKATPEHVKATAEMFDKMYGRRSEE